MAHFLTLRRALLSLSLSLSLLHSNLLLTTYFGAFVGASQRGVSSPFDPRRLRFGLLLGPPATQRDTRRGPTNERISSKSDTRGIGRAPGVVRPPSTTPATNRTELWPGGEWHIFLSPLTCVANSHARSSLPALSPSLARPPPSCICLGGRHPRVSGGSRRRRGGQGAEGTSRGRVRRPRQI